MLSMHSVESAIRYRHQLFVAAIVLWTLTYFYGETLQFDRSVENLFSQDAPELRSYRKLKKTFGGNEVVLAVYLDKQLFAASGEGLQRLQRVSRQLEAIEGVQGVLSLDRPIGSAILSDQAVARRVRKLFEGYTHDAEGTTVAIACMLSPEATSDASRAETMESMRRVLSDLPEACRPGYLTGEPVMVAEGFALVEADGARLGTWSTCLLGLTIAICFRSLRWVIVPIAVVQLSLRLTLALLALVGMELSMVSSMLTAIVTVVGIATVIHIVVRYQNELRTGAPPPRALALAGSALVAPVTWAILTDAIGFSALCLAHVAPVRDFGVMMAVGSLTVLISVPLLIPAMTLFAVRKPPAHLSEQDSQIGQKLASTVDGLVSRRWPLVIGLTLLTAVSLWGIRYLDVETDFTKNFRERSSIVRSYEIVESRLGGAGVCDIVIPAPDRLTWSFLNRVNQLRQELASMAELDSPSTHARGLTKILSLDDAARAAMNLPAEGKVEPSLTRNLGLRAALLQMRTSIPSFYAALYANADPDQAFYRIMLRARERQPAAAKMALIDNIRTVTQKHFSDGEVTGFFVLLAGMISSILSDQWLTFGVALVGISVMMCFAFRDPRYVAVALVPNVFPILIVTGAMGWLHQLGWTSLRMNMGAAMIAAVSIGLSVDSSIHYLTMFQREYRTDANLLAALRTAQSNVGQAMILSTLSLMVGFSVLCTSDFIPTVYFGVLVSLAMLGGLLGNLVMLPILLSITMPPARGHAPPNSVYSAENR